ncbi:MAG: hypothetical protein R3D25_13565 [Geminicoccaceae bacterium]
MPARLHPYLFLTPGRLDRIRQGLDASGSGHDPTVQKWVDKMRRRAREIILPKPILTPDWIAAGEGATAPVMLYTARAAVSRITILGLLWHIDKDGGEADRNGSGLEAQEWLARACRELLAIASFPDWQKPSLPPEVFLSVAEMCAAAAIGLDWLGSISTSTSGAGSRTRSSGTPSSRPSSNTPSGAPPTAAGRPSPTTGTSSATRAWFWER